MKDTQNRPQTDSSYAEQDQELDTSGQKGGTSQRNYNDSSSADQSSEMNETEEGMQEDSASW